MVSDHFASAFTNKLQKYLYNRQTHLVHYRLLNNNSFACWVHTGVQRSLLTKANDKITINFDSLILGKFLDPFSSTVLYITEYYPPIYPRGIVALSTTNWILNSNRFVFSFNIFEHIKVLKGMVDNAFSHFLIFKYTRFYKSSSGWLLTKILTQMFCFHRLLRSRILASCLHTGLLTRVSGHKER